MLNGARRKLIQKHNEAASREIKKLRESTQRLSLEKEPSLRIRNALRIYEHHYKRGALISRLYGMLAGLWFTMPFVITLDDRPGSMRSVLTSLVRAASETQEHAANSADLVTGILRIILAGILVVAYYAIVALGPIILGTRVGLGFSGVRAPGRRIILSCHRTGLIYSSYTILEACAEAIGKSGEKRINALQKTATKLSHFRGLLRTVHRFTNGVARRRRRRVVKAHVMRVDAYLGKLEESIEEMSDSELKELGAMVLEMAERCANNQYGNVLDGDTIAHVTVSDREPFRLLVTTLSAVAISATSLYMIDLFKLSSNLEPLAISSSVVISALAGYGKKAAEKVGQIRGIIGQ